MTALRLVKSEVSDAGFVEVREPSYPNGFGARRKKESSHKRVLKHGEIVRFIRMCLEEFFLNVLTEDVRHETLNISELREVVADPVTRWVRKMSGNENFILHSTGVRAAVLGLKIRQCEFVVTRTTVRLLLPDEHLPQARIHLKRAM
jgi:hypothetical protein